MFAQKARGLYYLHLLIVLVVILCVLFVTRNELAILGLMFVPQIPVMPESDNMTEAQGTPMGFTADVD